LEELKDIIVVLDHLSHRSPLRSSENVGSAKWRPTHSKPWKKNSKLCGAQHEHRTLERRWD